MEMKTFGLPRPQQVKSNDEYCAAHRVKNEDAIAFAIELEAMCRKHGIVIQNAHIEYAESYCKGDMNRYKGYMIKPAKGLHTWAEIMLVDPYYDNDLGFIRPEFV